MTYRPIPEERRRELAAFIPTLAEARRRHPFRDPDTERQFWTEHVLDIEKMNSRGPTSAAERLWLLRHAHMAVAGADPVRLPGFPWPGFCVRTGRDAAEEDWPLEPIPGAKIPPKEPPKETPGPNRPKCSVVIEGRVVEPGDVLYYKPDPRYPDFDGQARTVRDTVGTDEVRFTNGRWAPAAALTFVAPATPPIPGPKRADNSVVIEGRVVKPGDTIYVKASALTPGDDPKRTVARVGVNVNWRPRVWFTNDRWRSPTDLTFVAPARRAPSIYHQGPSFDFNRGLTDSDVKRTSLQVLNDYINRSMAMLTATPQILVDRAAFQQSHTQLQAAPTHPNLENTMNQTAQQATAFNADSLTVDTSNIVETKTFVFGRDITTLDDNDLLGNIQLLDQKIDKLEAINAKTPLAKLVTKIAQLKDAKAKIVELLGGAPVEQASPAVDADETKPKRVRRTKAEIEADARRDAEDKVEEKAVSATPVPPAPPAARATETDVDDLDLE